MKGPRPPTLRRLRALPWTGRELSHGEAFLALLGRRATSGGLYLLDEPDAALSFTGTVSLVVQPAGLVDGAPSRRTPSHEPFASWADLELIASWRQFLSRPESFLPYLS